jgi:hypothetical protein
MPTQAADPDVFNWWINRFPETKYIHLVRDPRKVVASMMKLGFNTWWREDPGSILHQWAEIEEWSLSIERKLPDQVIRLYQEDLAADPDGFMADLHSFLGLPKVVSFTNRGFKETKPIDLPNDELASEVIKEYEYGQGQRRRAA